MIQLAKMTFWEGSRHNLELWEEHLKDPIMALDKALKCPETPIGVVLCLKVLATSHANCNGLRLCGLKHFAKDVAVLGRRLALRGPVGQRAPARGVHPLECSREVWAAWRALFLPYKGVSGGFE